MNEASEISGDNPSGVCQATLLDSAEMTPEQLAEAKEYGRQALVCKLAETVLVVIFWGFVALCLAQGLGEQVSQGNFSAIEQLGMIVLVTLAVGECVTFPLSFYSGYVLEHRFGLSQLTFFGWLRFYAKQKLLISFYTAGYILGIYLIIWTCGPWWWLVAAGAIFLENVIDQLTPILNFQQLYKVQPLNDPRLTERLVGLAQGTGFRIKRVYRINLSSLTAKTTAVMAGLGPSRSVLLGDTLLDEFAPEEIEVIFAHELGHAVYHHILKTLLGVVLSNLVIFWICDLAIFTWGQSRYVFADYANMPPSTFPLLIFVWNLFLLVLSPLQNIARRHYERQSDQYALERTGNRAFVSAFTKLAMINKEDPYRHPLDTFLFHVHPPISDRLAIALH